MKLWELKRDGTVYESNGCKYKFGINDELLYGDGITFFDNRNRIGVLLEQDFTEYKPEPVKRKVQF